MCHVHRSVKMSWNFVLKDPHQHPSTRRRSIARVFQFVACAMCNNISWKCHCIPFIHFSVMLLSEIISLRKYILCLGADVTHQTRPVHPSMAILITDRKELQCQTWKRYITFTVRRSSSQLFNGVGKRLERLKTKSTDKQRLTGSNVSGWVDVGSESGLPCWLFVGPF